MLRRTILKAMAAAPVALRADVTQTVGASANQQYTGAAINKLTDYPNPITGGPLQGSISTENYPPLRDWLKNSPEYIAELRDHINRETLVAYIDADLLAMRSLSTAARIYYMRQRLVDRQLRIQLEDREPSSLWGISTKWLDVARKALGV